jgi:hypothetical protein
MPPKKNLGEPARRKGPAFKPPRPVKPPVETAKPSTKGPSGGARTAPKKAAASRATLEQVMISSSSEQEEEDAISDLDVDEDMVDELSPQPKTSHAQGPPSEEETRSPVPLPLLARLLQEGFVDKETRIEKGALELTGRYIETFVREAIARAAFERSDATQGGGMTDGFLQVEDLEKLAPQLILDF